MKTSKPITEAIQKKKKKKTARYKLLKYNSAYYTKLINIKDDEKTHESKSKQSYITLENGKKNT